MLNLQENYLKKLQNQLGNYCNLELEPILKTMLIVHVFVQVKEDRIEDFKKATVKNAQNSVKEKGIARFDIIQQQDDPARFVLMEVYRTADDPARHKETAHYKKWRDAVADMMAEPRSAIKYSNVYPNEEGWD
jgi:quinol monooxygenase YgiN